jgi:excisionase family DNA binding protein
MDEQLFTAAQAAKFLHVSVKTIRTWAQKGCLKGMKVGPRGDWRFMKKDLLKMINKK